MKFVSYEYVVFLIATWTLFCVTHPRWRWALLLAASYIFYASWSIPFIGMILLTTSIDYFAGNIIHKSTDQRARKIALGTAIGANLAVLGFFKYFNFFLSAHADLMELFGWRSTLPQHLEILLPIGISYYSFEAIAYVVDVYRGAKPLPNWFRYNFYIMYFPHLLAGPIIRFEHLYSQYKHTMQLPSLARIAEAIELILFGYAMKVVLADSCSTIADPVFANTHASALALYAAALAFSLQIYFDFAGYTNIARGSSLLFNIELPQNFSFPYNARNMIDFWHRWQITLSRWLHDYVFRPLGGATKSLPKTLRNILITLFIAGVWHGAGWTYCLLGLYSGLMLAICHAYRRYRKSLFGARDREITEHPAYRAASRLLTVGVVIFGMVIFRSPSLQTVVDFATGMANVPALIVDIGRAEAAQLAVLFALIGVMAFERKAVATYRSLFASTPYWFKVQAATAAVVICWIMAGTYTPPFIYFQF
jgi:alginate O-acetyltransferase complex protein AlgI